MGKFKSGLFAQLKRVGRVFPLIIVLTLVLTLCIVLLGAALQQSNENSDRRQKVMIGLVGDTQASYLSFGIIALQRWDSSRLAIDFTEMSEEEAKEKLRTGEIAAYVAIPEGFVEDFDRGEDVRVTYATSNDSAGLGSLIMEELIDTISDVVMQSRNAIMGTWRIMRDHVAEEERAGAADGLYLKYVSLFLNRTMFYSVKIAGISSNLSFVSYYFVAIVILFMLLWGITCSSLFVGRDISLAKLLKARGQNTLSQVMAEYLAYLVLMLGNMFLMILPVEAAFHLLGIQLQEWGTESFSGLVLFLVRMIPAAALLAGLQLFLYELASDMVSGILLQFLTGLGLGYLSGCFYPVSFLPGPLGKIAPFLPSGAALQYGAGCLQGQPVWREIGIMACYLLLFWGLTAAVRERRLRA